MSNNSNINNNCPNNRGISYRNIENRGSARVGDSCAIGTTTATATTTTATGQNGVSESTVAAVGPTTTTLVAQALSGEY
jgi:hypothetical protein